MGAATEFASAARWAAANLTFDIDRRVHTFELTIRALGGLLSAHTLATADPALLPGALPPAPPPARTLRRSGASLGVDSQGRMRSPQLRECAAAVACLRLSARMVGGSEAERSGSPAAQATAGACSAPRQSWRTA